MRTTILSILCVSLILVSCDKSDTSKDPTQAEVYALHEAAGKVQAGNVGAVMEVASKEKALSIDDLIEPVARLSVTDIVVNEKDDDHSGNARVVLLDKMLTSQDHLKLFDAADTYGRILKLQLPLLPSEVRPGSSNEIFVRSAVFTREAPTKNANTEYFAGYRAMVEEFVSLKYLLLLRTIAIKPPQQVEPGVYSPGVYGGQLMVFDLAKRELLGTLPIMTSNRKGEKMAGVDYDLNLEVEKQIRKVLAMAQGKASPAKPPAPASLRD